MNTYFYKQIISIIHAEIRLVDKNKDVVRRYAGTQKEKDRLNYDKEFFNEIMSRKILDIPDIICENETVYYAKLDFSEGTLLIGPIQVMRGSSEIPYCELSVFLNSVLLVYNQLTGREVLMDELCRYHFISERTKDIDEIGIGDKVFDTQEHQVMHNPYNHESRKLESIKNGDIDELKRCQNEVWTGRIGTVADNPVRQEKNIGIIVIVLASRAAIVGGLSPELAFTMADAFIMRIEKMSNIMQIRAAIYEYELEFAKSVKKLQKPIKRNKYVEQAKDYVFKHLHSEIRVQDISKHIGINKDYLSDLFHRSEGMTLQNYIKQEKIRQAEYLLKYQDYSISEIANYLSYSSQSHFSHCFKEIKGMTPMQYRNKYSKN